MQAQDSTPGAPVQGEIHNQRGLAIWAGRMRRVSKEFGWPMLILLLVGPSALRNTDSNQLVLRLFLGLGPALCGVGLRVWSRGYLRADGFVLDGPYRYVRNPVELGAALAYVGAALLLGLSLWYILFIAALTWIYLSVVGVVTDQELIRRYGSKYLGYMRRVRRWMPAGLPGTNRSYRNYSLRQGIYLEYESLVWLAGFALVFALKKRFG